MTKIVTVVCQRCGQKLNVKGADNATSGTVTCPKCSNKLRVTFPAMNGGGGDAAANAPFEDKTVYDKTIYDKDKGPQAAQQPQPSGQGADETELPAMSGIQNPGLILFNGQPLRNSNGEPNRLLVGQNIIGRADPSSPANMQIPTRDVYCSRQQAIITVLRMNNGSLRTFIRNYKNKNKTWINNVLLQDGEEIELKNGDCIKLADTIVYFVNQ